MEVDTRAKAISTLLPLGILACFLATFWSSFHKLYLRWNTGDDNYCFLIIPLFIYLCWEKRAIFKFGEYSWNPWGLLVAAFSLGLMVLGEKGSAETLIYIGIWGCMVGMAVMLYGSRVRRLAFPLLILAFIVPLPPFINRMLTFNLKMVASSISVGMLRLASISVVQEGNIIDLGLDKLQMADACSGLRYFMPMVLMALLIGLFFSRRLRDKIILLVLVVPLSILINSLRVFASGIFTVTGHPELAQNLFHDFSGWLAFMVAGIVLAGVAYLLNKIGTAKADAAHPDTGAAPAGMRRQVVLSLIMCALLVSGGILMHRGATAANLPPRISFENFPMQIGAWVGQRAYLSDEIMASLWADDYVSATFRSASSPNAITVLIPFYAYQGTRHTAHAPQSCLLGGGWSLESTEDHALEVAPGKTITIRLLNLKMGEQQMLGSYFFLQRGRVIVSPWMNKYWLMHDSLLRGRTDGALVRIELLAGQGLTKEQALEELTGFIKLIWPMLDEYVPS